MSDEHMKEAGQAELLPCPFCGGGDVAVLPVEDNPDYDSDYSVAAGCLNCAASGPDQDFKSAAAAIAAWNRRSPAPADKMREALEPFSKMAGELFARNRNRDEIAFAVYEPDCILTVGDFFNARAALSSPASGGEERLFCHDCGLIYGGPGWADFVVPDDAWAKIVAAGTPANILCANCMARRAETAGIECRGSFTSGPFADHKWTKEPAPTASPEREAVWRAAIEAAACVCRAAAQREADNGNAAEDDRDRMAHFQHANQAKELEEAIRQIVAPPHPREEAQGEAVPVAYQWRHTDPISGNTVWREKQYWNGHSSKESRPLYSTPVSAEAIRREERERCARIADEAEKRLLEERDHFLGKGPPDMTAALMRARQAQVVCEIAAAIRALDTEGQS